MGIIFAILNAVLLGTANFFLKKSFKDFPPSVAFFIFSLLTIFIWAPIGIFLGVNFQNIFFGLFVGTVSAILGQAIYVYVLEKGEVSITSTILSSFSIYTIIFSMIFNHEKLGSITMFLIILTILGTLIVSLPERFDKKDLKKVNYIFWAVFAAICIGASDTLSKYYINTTSVGSFLFYVSFPQLIIGILYFSFDKQSFSQFKTIFYKLDQYKYALWGSFCIAISTLCLFLSFNFTLASIASPIGAAYPIITITLALLFLKEKISIKNWIGLILVLFSVITIGVVNP